MKDYRQLVCKFMPESTCKLIPTKSDYNYLRGSRYIYYYINNLYKRKFITSSHTFLFSHTIFASALIC